MTTYLYDNPTFLEHVTGPHHPECPARLTAVGEVLDGANFRELKRIVAPRASDAQLSLMHPQLYIDQVLSSEPVNGLVHLDADTVMSPGSGNAALCAAGAVCAAVDAVVAGEANNAFCAVRPPGHHAEASRAMGFCLFNSIAVAAEYARTEHGLARVGVVDFDVHHGNGTQALFWDREGLFYGSTHQYPNYPGTGTADETGAYANIVNAPLAPGTGSAEFRAAMKERILPALDDFRPELVLVSAGFDAHWRDPLAQLNLDEDDYAWSTAELMAVADAHAGGRLVSALEGGYDLEGLAASAAAHVTQLMTAT